MNKLGNKFTRRFALYLTLSGLVIAGSMSVAVASASSNSVNVWWPTDGAHITGVQPFKAMVPGLDITQYDMFWQVDGGAWVWMDNNYTDSPHKEASVDVTSWTWHGSGPYVVNFIARQGSTVIAEQSENIYVDNGMPVLTPPPAANTPVAVSAASPSDVSVSLPTTTVAATSAPAVEVSAPVTTITSNTQTQTLVPNTIITSPLMTTSSVANLSGLYVNPTSEAATQAAAWATSNVAGATAMQTLAAQPTAVWFGDWNSNVENDVQTLVSAAAAQGTTPVLVAYNIPERDCGGFSAGGSDNPAGYTAWINSFAQGLGSNKAIVILEPDALAEITCLSAADQATRLQLLSSAVSAIKADTNAKVYIDAGHSNWIDPATMAGELQKANVSQADGFSLNVSNFMPTAGEVSFGEQINSQLTTLIGQEKHFVVDTSRNGNGSNGQWCNPPGMAIGQKPTLQTGNSEVDAFLWIKTPGESDGTCNGGPAAGVWWSDYALGLVQNAH